MTSARDYKIALAGFTAVLAAGCGEPDLPTLPSIPALLSPAEGATLDNGCYSRTDTETWDFRWSPVKNAARYHLVVQHPGAENPAIDVTTASSFYHHVSYGGYVINRFRYGWEWKVQAEVNGAFGVFSEARTFNVEPVDTDCPGT